MSAVWGMDLSTTDKMVLLALADWSNDDGVCWPSMAQLEVKTSLTNRAIRASVARLKEAGHLSREERSGKGVIYTLHPGTTFRPEANAPRNETTLTPEPRSTNTSRTIITSEAKASSVSVKPRKADIAAGFLAFWQAYPKRVGKDAAAKSFDKAMSRIKEDDPLSVILAGIERALPGWDDPQFIPNPATWLNQGRWADDAPTPRRETRNASGYTDARSAKVDHLDAISRAMAAALDRPEREHRGHSENSDAQGRMRSLAAPS